jgi:uncharacterized damage-inducible protein DinB
MNELESILIGDSYAAPPDHILEGLAHEIVHRVPPGAPHSIYQEVWHMAFWQELMLDWVKGKETTYPGSPAEGFPTVEDMEKEYWPKLHERFFAGAQQSAECARQLAGLDRQVRCTSSAGQPVRTKTVRDLLESFGAHNAYHLGRIVLLRQQLDAWPPKSGGFKW